jgi:hypothetical protein
MLGSPFLGAQGSDETRFPPKDMPQIEGQQNSIDGNYPAAKVIRGIVKQRFQPESLPHLCVPITVASNWRSRYFPPFISSSDGATANPIVRQFAMKFQPQAITGGKFILKQPPGVSKIRLRSGDSVTCNGPSRGSTPVINARSSNVVDLMRSCVERHASRAHR